MFDIKRSDLITHFEIIITWGFTLLKMNLFN